MMAKDSVQNRLENGMSFTEFSYQLVQGYDFYYLWKNEGVMLQMGGSDQWGNIVTGAELIRKKASGEAFALTTQLIKKSDGTKFGKSEKGNIWLDPNRTSPYKFYQFWLNAADDDAKNYIKIFTLKTKEEVESLIAEHDEAPHERKLQKALAEDITARVHNIELLERAKLTTSILFGSSWNDFIQLNASELEATFDEADVFTIDKSVLFDTDLVSILAEQTTIYPSKGEARKALQANAVSVNKDKVSIDKKLNDTDLLHGTILLIQKGKKNYYLIKVK
jgi:tyrosyl-tRNA synthetase